MKQFNLQRGLFSISKAKVRIFSIFFLFSRIDDVFVADIAMREPYNTLGKIEEETIFEVKKNQQLFIILSSKTSLSFVEARNCFDTNSQVRALKFQ